MKNLLKILDFIFPFFSFFFFFFVGKQKFCPSTIVVNQILIKARPNHLWLGRPLLFKVYNFFKVYKSLVFSIFIGCTVTTVDLRTFSTPQKKNHLPLALPPILLCSLPLQLIIYFCFYGLAYSGIS